MRELNTGRLDTDYTRKQENTCTQEYTVHNTLEAQDSEGLLIHWKTLETREDT